jgi:hypothetical protein
MGDLNLDYEKIRENSYQHRKIYDGWLRAITNFNFIQNVKEPGKEFTTPMFEHQSLTMSMHGDNNC